MTSQVRFAGTLVVLGLLVGLLMAPVVAEGASNDDRHLTVLVYHHFGDSSWISTPMDQFRQQMDYLQEEGFTFLTMEQVIHHLDSGRPFPSRSILIMVDDGYQSFHDDAYDYLKEQSIPVVLAPYTRAQNEGYADYMDWELLGRLTADPLIHVANHSWSHGSLARVDESDGDWFEREVLRPERDIITRLGVSPLGYVFPYGSYEWNVVRRLADENIHSFGSQPGVIVAGETPPPYPRIALRQNIDLDKFKQLVNRLPLRITTTTIPNGYRVNNLPDRYYFVVEDPDGILDYTVTVFFNGTRKTVEPHGEGMFSFSIEREELSFWNEVQISAIDPNSGRFRIGARAFVYEPARHGDGPVLVDAEEQVTRDELDEEDPETEGPEEEEAMDRPEPPRGAPYGP